MRGKRHARRPVPPLNIPARVSGVARVRPRCPCARRTGRPRHATQLTPRATLFPQLRSDGAEADARRPRVSMVALGCPKNVVDGEVMLGDLARAVRCVGGGGGAEHAALHPKHSAAPRCCLEGPPALGSAARRALTAGHPFSLSGTGIRRGGRARERRCGRQGAVSGVPLQLPLCACLPTNNVRSLAVARV